MRPLLLAAALAACAHAPKGDDTNRKRELVVETEVGILVEKALETSYGEYPDAALSAYVTEVGLRVARHSERPDVAWHFRVLDSPEATAHAIPGGRITITRGLLAYLGSEAELAAALAHEIAHVAFRHSHSGWHPSAPVAEIGDAAEAHERSRNADKERQADAVAIRYLGEAGYDPHAIIAVFAALERAARGEARDPADPHPAPPTRIARATIAASSGSGTWERERYLTRIARLAWGDASIPHLAGSRYVIPGDIYFNVPPEFSAKVNQGRLEAGPLEAFRMPRSVLTDAVKSALTKDKHTTRTIASSRTATIGESLAIIEEKAHAILILVGGARPAATLDTFLASAAPDTTPPKPRRAITIERVTAASRFADFVHTRCPRTSPDLAASLNGRALDEPVTPPTLVKCLR